MQGLLELANVPYVGPGVLASAVGMDKAVMKVMFAARGLPVVRVEGVHATRVGAAPRRRCIDERAALGLPLFVKPANLGSSVGHLEGEDRGRSRAARSSRRSSSIARSSSRRRCRRRARSNARCSATTSRRRRSPARSSRRASSTTTRRSISTQDSQTVIPADLTDDAGRPRSSGSPSRRSARSTPPACRASTFCSRGTSGDDLRQRDQHHPRLHHDQHVREDVGGERRHLSGAGRSADPARARAPRRRSSACARA